MGACIGAHCCIGAYRYIKARGDIECLSLISPQNIYLTLFMCVGACLHTTCVLSNYMGGQLGALDSPELELHMAVSHEVGVRSGIHFWNNSQCS